MFGLVEDTKEKKKRIYTKMAKPLTLVLFFLHNGTNNLQKKS